MNTKKNLKSLIACTLGLCLLFSPVLFPAAAQESAGEKAGISPAGEAVQQPETTLPELLLPEGDNSGEGTEGDASPDGGGSQSGLTGVLPAPELPAVSELPALPEGSESSGDPVLSESPAPPEGSTLPEGSTPPPVPVPDNLCGQVGDMLETQEHMGYINGYSDGTFRPEGRITRAEVAQIFYNLLLTEPEITVSFPDVNPNEWYGKPLLSLASLGLFKGYPDGGLHPSDSITRAEFVALAARLAEFLEGEAAFSDVNWDDWYGLALRSAVAHGWIGGYPDGTFRPGEPITRAEAVKIFNRMLERYGDDNAHSYSITVSFGDVGRVYWAYREITEAATPHDYQMQNGREQWHDVGGWQQKKGDWFYFDTGTNRYLTGFCSIGSYVYYFDPGSGALRTGWQVIGGKHYLLPDRSQEDRKLAYDKNLTRVNFTAGNRGYGDIKYITVHYTSEPNDTPWTETESFKDKYRGASAGYFVDQNDIVQCVEDKNVSWHCGNDVYYHDACRNNNSIGIEMCTMKTDDKNATSPYDDDWYFTEGTKQNTAALVRELMMKYAVPLENVVRHNDISHKTCPAPFVNSFAAWQDFLKLVDQGQTGYKGYYAARITASLLNVRSGPGTDYPKIGELGEGDIITVYRETGKDNQLQGRWVEIDGGWVMYEYISRLA